MPPIHRIASVVLPELACELACERNAAWATRPLAVVLETEETRGATGDDDADALVGTHEIFAASELARARGVRPGMRVAAAMARTADLAFAHLSERALAAALAVVAETLFEFGATVELRPFDVVSVDVTGGAHLFGGEASLAREIAARIATLGWRAHVAISDGPDLATALARFGMHPGVQLVSVPGAAREALAPLPIAALPLDGDAARFLGRLGVLTLRDLMRIDRAQLASRLDAFFARSGAQAGRRLDAKTVLGWLDGRDERPLVPYVPPVVLGEEVSFEDGVETASQLVFALRGAVSRLSARLVGRRQATGRIDLLLHYDRTIFRLAASSVVTAEPMLALAVDLPAPLAYTDDLFRAIKAKLENLALAAPVVRLELALSRIDRAPIVELDLSRDRSVHPDALPALLSELSAEIGAERVGVLTIHDDHRPELRTRLVGVHESEEREAARLRAARRANERARAASLEAAAAPRAALAPFSLPALEPPEPTRLLDEPIALGVSVGGDGRLPPLRPGVTLDVGGDTFVVDAIRFDRRLDGIAWWSESAASRDYLRVTLVGDEPRGAASSHAGRFAESGSDRREDRVTGVVVAGPWQRANGAASSAPRRAAHRGPVAEAWVYVDRRTGEVFLQGWWE